MSYISSGSASRSQQSRLRRWLVILLLVGLSAILVPQKTRALTISEEELARLETILTELQTANSQLQSQLGESQNSLEKLRTSFDAYAAEAEKTAVDLINEKQALQAQRDTWRTACLWGGVGAATAIAILVTFLVIK